VSTPDNNSLTGLLSSFALGPSWARDAAEPAKTHAKKERKHDPSHEGDALPRERREFRERRDDRGDRGKSRFSRDQAPREPIVTPAAGVRVTIIPDPEAVRLIGKEVHQVARVYPLFDVAKIIIAERSRCRAILEIEESRPPLLHGKIDGSLFVTREEAARHLWNSDLRQQFVEEETVEIDPPSGNFQSIARCGLSGELLGPPNFHAYQSNLRRVHRERFPNMPFEAYAAKVRTERSEEVVNAWLESMKKKTRWRIKGDGDDAWIENQADAERALAARHFDDAFEALRKIEIPATISNQLLSPSLALSLKLAGMHARENPACLIPVICRAIEAEHLPIFKRKGKLYTGPARPSPLPKDAVLAARPAIMVEWIRSNTPAKLAGLWEAVLPEGGNAPPAEFAADLFWLLHQGHILLFTNDTLVVQEVIEKTAPASTDASDKPKRKKKKSKNKAATPATGEESNDDSTADAESVDPDASEAPISSADDESSPISTPEVDEPPAL
jgi:hypothetical protein